MNRSNDSVDPEVLCITKLTMFMNGLIDVEHAAKDVTKSTVTNDAINIAKDEIKKKLISIAEMF